ncbi:hypothetical protein V1477_010229 [Vespula maculifrons]|uniref:Uncharacterized protein n=1 Tax=Vespula maculifrons TaxID=7453 RepID=A0ABD2CA35_VESMC
MQSVKRDNLPISTIGCPLTLFSLRCLLTKANARWVVLDRAPKPATSPPTTFPLSLPPPSLLGTTEFP